MIKAWTTENYEHKGKFWNLRMPMLRPRPYTKPHPFIIRACSGEEAMLGMARAGRPFLMNIQSNEITATAHGTLPQDDARERLRRGHHSAQRGRHLGLAQHIRRRRPTPRPSASPCRRGKSSRNSGRRCARRSTRSRGCCCTRKRDRPRATRCSTRSSAAPPRPCPRRSPRSTSIGVGGLILVFRIGPMPIEVAEASIRLFMKKVAPEFRKTRAAAVGMRRNLGRGIRVDEP